MKLQCWSPEFLKIDFVVFKLLSDHCFISVPPENVRKPQNGQTHSNNLLPIAYELFECVWPFYSFQTFSGCIKKEHWAEIGQSNICWLFRKKIRLRFRTLRHKVSMKNPEFNKSEIKFLWKVGMSKGWNLILRWILPFGK